MCLRAQTCPGSTVGRVRGRMTAGAGAQASPLGKLCASALLSEAREQSCPGTPRRHLHMADLKLRSKPSGEPITGDLDPAESPFIGPASRSVSRVSSPQLSPLSAVALPGTCAP